MAIGIFGGTFDPVHIGHLRAEEEARERYSLDAVYFVPSSTPPHKSSYGTSGADVRLVMLRKAIRGNRHLRISEVEIMRGGISYSIDTIRIFEKRFPDIYFLVGIDAFAEIETWHKYSEIFSHTNIVVMVRPTRIQPTPLVTFPPDMLGSVKTIDDTTFEHRSGKRIYVHHVTQLDVSSTKIRESVRKGGSIRYLVSRPVEKFINERRLYTN
jgi:nicotinate-nucleotide adenylyltransferase